MRRFKTGIAVLLAMVLAMSAAAVGGASVAQAEGPAASFDWSMPARYGLDENGDGMIDSFVGTTSCDVEGQPCVEHPPTSVQPAVPESWHVDLDACASADAVEFRWRVLWPDVTVEQRPGGGCGDFFADFPAEGTYRVELQVGNSAGEWSPWTRLEVVVQDWLIVAMGDSYGSGEGAPDVASEMNPELVADAFEGLGGALAELADLGPCGPVGFDFDTCASLLAERNDAAIDQALADIQRLNNPVCAFGQPGFDVLGCAELLLLFGFDLIGQTVEAIVGAAANVYDTYVDRFVAVYEEAVGVVTAIETTIENWKRSAQWQDRRCHRSANAGAALAAQHLEAIDPRTSVTFVHVACTGAMIFQGLLDTYAGAETEREAEQLSPLPPQIEQAAAIIGNRELDVVQLSIGGNDVNFGPMIFSCILRVDCSQPNTVDDPQLLADAASALYCDAPFVGLATLLPVTADGCHALFAALAVDPLMEKDAGTLFNEGRDGGTGDPLRPGIILAYQALSERLHDALDAPEPGLGLPTDRADRVFISEYVSPLRRHDGQVCGQFGDNVIPGLSFEEATWLDAEIVPALTAIVHERTPDEWNVVGGIESGFGEGHGYCADPDGDAGLAVAFGAPQDGRWMRRLEESILTQANHMGAVHPNRSGYRHYAQQILPTWLDALYSDPDALAGPRRPDQLPYADAGPTRVLDEGEWRLLTNESYDGDGDPLTFAWSEQSAAIALRGIMLPAATVDALDDGTGAVHLEVDDGDEGTATSQAMIVVRNVTPSVAGGTATALEGTPFVGSAGFTDPGPLDTHTATVDYGDGASAGSFSVGAGTVPLAHTWADDGLFEVAVTVTDDDGGTNDGTIAVTVANAPPVVGPVAAPLAPVLIDTPVTVSATFTDAGVNDTHTATIDWGDGVTTAAAITETGGTGSATGAKTYTEPGIHTVTVHVTDDDGDRGSAQFQYVVVYDPSGGFVTGGGVLDSPAGAYTPDLTVAGPANFAFVSKYQKGASVPVGTTSFRFRAADFVFTSTAYEWLVVNGGTRATYKGRGPVNGAGDYGFLLSVVDGDTTGDTDRLRLKVWDRPTGVVVYDNQASAGEDALASTAIAAGAITVSPPKKG